MFYITKELKENQNEWLLIISGQPKVKRIFTEKGKLPIKTNVFVDDIILNIEIDQELSKKIKYNQEHLVGYNKQKIYYDLTEISKDMVAEIVRIIEEHGKSDGIAESIQSISKTSNIMKYVEKLNQCLEILDNLPYNSRYYDMVLEQINSFRAKQLELAKKTGKKQLVYFEVSHLSMEQKGAYIKKEYIFPDGTTEEFEGFENEV